MVRSTAVAALRTALDSHPILAGLSSSALDDVWQSGVVEHFEPGAALSREGDPARHYWLLLSGSVKVSYLSPDGFEVTVKLFGAPAAWAEMQVLTGKPHIEDCVAVDVSTSLKVPRAAFERLLEAWPRFMKNVLYDTCARFFISAQHERALAFLPVERRLANLLFAHVRMYGIPVEGGVGFRHSLNQSELAQSLGVARRSITRIITDWREKGLVIQRGHALIVCDLEGVAALASADSVGLVWRAGSAVGGPAGRE